MNKQQVIEILRQHRSELTARGVKDLFLFGSVARGEESSRSDVDLLVEFSQPVGMFEFIDLNQYLESLLGCPVDLGTPRSLKPYLKNQVIKEAIHVT